MAQSHVTVGDYFNSPIVKKAVTKFYLYGWLLGVGYVLAAIYARATNSLGTLFITTADKKVPLVALRWMMVIALIILVFKVIHSRTADAIPNAVRPRLFVIFRFMVILVSLMAGTSIPLIISVAILAF